MATGASVLSLFATAVERHLSRLNGTKSMAFKGRDPVRTTLVIDNKIIEQVNSFNYLRNISYEKRVRPRLWSSGQSFWLQIQRSRVRFSALPGFLSSSGSGTGSTQPREVN